MFAMTRETDAVVRFAIQANTGRAIAPRTLSITRFDGALIADSERGLVMLGDAGMPTKAGDLGTLRVEAQPLWDPDRDSIVLQNVGVDLWQFEPEIREPGPWLILGWSENWCRTRPLLWEVECVTESRPSNLLSISEITRIPDQETRGVRFDEVFARLAIDPGDSEWAAFDRYIPAFQGVPATTLDLMSRLSANDQACALALLRCSDDQFGAFWSWLETMPFAWCLVPVRAWARSAKAYWEWLKEVLASVPDVLEAERKRLIETLTVRLPKWMCGGGVIGGLVCGLRS